MENCIFIILSYITLFFCNLILSCKLPAALFCGTYLVYQIPILVVSILLQLAKPLDCQRLYRNSALASSLNCWVRRYKNKNITYLECQKPTSVVLEPSQLWGTLYFPHLFGYLIVEGLVNCEETRIYTKSQLSTQKLLTFCCSWSKCRLLCNNLGWLLC